MEKPNFFRRFIMGVVYLWRRAMDVKFNPLKYVPDASLQAYFMVVLFTLWSVSFGLIATHYFGWVDYSILASILVHLSILIPIVVTNAVFVDAERKPDYVGATHVDHSDEELDKAGHALTVAIKLCHGLQDPTVQ